MTRRRLPAGYVAAALAAAALSACSKSEQGVIQAQADDPAITLSEEACPGPCPVYDMTLHPDGAYVLNGQRFVKTEGVSEGNIGADAYADAEEVLDEADFWVLPSEQTEQTLPNCQPDAPTVKITWRTDGGKEKTLTYNAGCGVREMEALVRSLRAAFRFEDLVWTDDKFDPAGRR